MYRATLSILGDENRKTIIRISSSLKIVKDHFDTILPYDPMNLEHYLIPWWNQELYEEFGAKVPTGLFKNQAVVTDIERATQFFTERTNIRVDNETIFFDGGSFRPGEDFALKFPNLQLLGNSQRQEYCVFKTLLSNHAFECVERFDPTNQKLEEATISVDRSLHVAPFLGGVDELRTTFGDGPGSVVLWKNFVTHDRVAAIEEVKKSIIWKAFA